MAYSKYKHLQIAASDPEAAKLTPDQFELWWRGLSWWEKEVESLQADTRSQLQVAFTVAEKRSILEEAVISCQDRSDDCYRTAMHYRVMFVDCEMFATIMVEEQSTQAYAWHKLGFAKLETLLQFNKDNAQ